MPAGQSALKSTLQNKCAPPAGVLPWTCRCRSGHTDSVFHTLPPGRQAQSFFRGQPTLHSTNDTDADVEIWGRIKPSAIVVGHCGVAAWFSGACLAGTADRSRFGPASAYYVSLLLVPGTQASALLTLLAPPSTLMHVQNAGRKHLSASRYIYILLCESS